MVRRRIDLDVLQAIEDLALRGATPAQIQRELARRPSLAGRVPVLRTVQRVVRDLTGVDDSEAWRLRPDAEADPATVMWAAGASLLDGWRFPISELEARWISAVHRAVPDLGPLTTRYVARIYVTSREDTSWLDRALAIAPWRGAMERAAYEALHDQPRLRVAMTAQQAAR